MKKIMAVLMVLWLLSGLALPGMAEEFGEKAEYIPTSRLLRWKTF